MRNQIADYVELSGIIRTLTPETRLFARKRVREICEQTASMMGGRAELIVEPSYSPLINNDRMVDLVRTVACAQFGSDKVILRDVPSLGWRILRILPQNVQVASSIWVVRIQKKSDASDTAVSLTSMSDVFRSGSSCISPASCAFYSKATAT